MYTFFLILIGIACLLMILVVLVQNSKGGGLASNFAGSNQIMGVRKTTDFIEKFTWGLAVAIVVFSLVASVSLPKASSNAAGVETELTKQVKEKQAQPIAPIAAPVQEAPTATPEQK
ncbi:MAG: preprotein translocase subunit SecG [Hyphomicrobiales bacterium]